MNEQMNSYKNPYRPLVDDGESFYPKERVFADLDSFLVNVQEASPLSIIAERGIGGTEAIRSYLQSRKDRLRFRVVECNLKNELCGGNDAVDFYRNLVEHVKESLGPLPESANSYAEIISSRIQLDPSTFKMKVEGFFRILRNIDPERPILLVFYFFDCLPGNYHFDPGDWILLRRLYNNTNNRLYYLVHSRTPISTLEKLNKIDSLFGGIFQLLRLNLLKPDEARCLATKPALACVGEDPWPVWILERIIEWGGRNQACIEILCFHLFDLIWNQHCLYREEDTANLENNLYSYLKQGYFSRLYEHLEEDNLLSALAHAATKGYRSSLLPKIDELVYLGYFLPETVAQRQYILFSPLFRRYLIERGVIIEESKASSEEAGESTLPRVAEILNMSSPPDEILDWFEGEFRVPRPPQKKPDLDKFSQFYLTGIYNGLIEEELSQLKSRLCEKYLIESEIPLGQRDHGDLQRNFHTELRRWKERYEKAAKST
jgi:hypothetical protein